jgi:hypothetical protein
MSILPAVFNQPARPWLLPKSPPPPNGPETERSHQLLRLRRMLDRDEQRRARLGTWPAPVTLPGRRPAVTIADIVDVVGRLEARLDTRPLELAAYLARRATRKVFKDIGHELKMHPQAARNAFLKVDGLRHADDYVRNILTELEAELGIAGSADAA